MDQFFKELYQGDLNLHDVWQMEIETSISHPEVSSSDYTQEVYLFIPSSLQISSKTYPKESFYSDRTNFIREKTPDIHLKKLLEKSFLEEYLYRPHAERKKIKNILFMIANIFRSSLRKYIQGCFFESLVDEKKEIQRVFCKLSNAVKHIRGFLDIWHSEIEVLCLVEGEVCKTARRYISISIENYFSYFLLHLKENKLLSDKIIDDIKSLLTEEKMYRKLHFSEPFSLFTLSEEEKEEVLYQRSGDEKSIRSILYFLLERRSFSERWNNIIGSCAAGIAAFVYLGIILWKSTFFVMNSMTFVVLSSFLYMLKDRMKEGVKNLFQRQAGKFFDDFRTNIFDNATRNLLGSIHEYFMFLHTRFLPDDITEFCRLPEECLGECLYYRKKIVFGKDGVEKKSVRDLHAIFRLNLRAFFSKASNPYEEVAVFDPISSDSSLIRLPKTYHLYCIIKTSQSSEESLEKKTTYQKYLLFVDKSGIQRIVRM